MQKLNAREAMVLDYIRELLEVRGYAPSVREIGAALGYRSTSTVQMYIDRLEEKGYLRRTEGKSRSIALCQPRLRKIPILPAGADVQQGEFDGALDFCYCGALPPAAVLFAVAIPEEGGYAVLVQGEETTDDTTVAYRSKNGIALCKRPELPEDVEVLGNVLALIREY